MNPAPQTRPAATGRAVRHVSAARTRVIGGGLLAVLGLTALVLALTWLAVL